MFRAPLGRQANLIWLGQTPRPIKHIVPFALNICPRTGLGIILVVGSSILCCSSIPFREQVIIEWAMAPASSRREV